jgi:hypothetical protein
MRRCVGETFGLPVVRGALTVPVAMTEENTLRFSAF